MRLTIRGAYPLALGDVRRICHTAECLGLPIVMLDHCHRMAAAV